MNEKPFTIHVIEDNEWYNKLLIHNLSLNPDYIVKGFLTATEFFKYTGDAADVVTLDYRLPDMDGVEALQKIKTLNPDAEVIIVSEQDNINTAVDLLKQGAYDYIVKEKDIRERLLSTVNNIRKSANLKTRISVLEKEVQKKYDFQNSIIGSSPAILNIFQLIEKAISANITVTVTGETGTGKEVVAKAIHYNSARKNKPFVAVNLSAIPSELIESELFGHEKGSFTGAMARRIGKFEEADGGTLFLDEIGEMDIAFQAKLLRALQEKEIVRVGSNSPVKVDCRIIVATHRNLQNEIKSGKFREDLYYRLFGLSIELPPLRERGKDILILSKYFIEKFCKENNLKAKSLSEAAQKKLLAYLFPGNVRELKSIIELAVVMSAADEIQANEISLTAADVVNDVLNEELTMKDYELRILKSYLKKYNDNIKLVAEKLDIGQSTIYRILKNIEERGEEKSAKL
ncbi:MAG TPA: sigma-54 dependent transcriptional regulator [Bacteroidia bacterium]|jgi:two-component system response regulator AtoC|nr:sigma-54 dependent transcriptional regulator [Bacteroidia bacterium]